MVYIYFSLDFTRRLQTRFSCIKVLPEHKFRRYSANRPSQWNFWRKYFDRVVAQSWFLQFWRSDECPKGITMISEVQESWERISFFKVAGEAYLIFEKFQKMEERSQRAGFCSFGGPMSGPKESHWFRRSRDPGREFHISKSQERHTWFKKNSKKSSSGRTELVFAVLEVRLVSQRNHIDFGGPRVLRENFIFQNPRRAYLIFEKSQKMEEFQQFLFLPLSNPFWGAHSSSSVPLRIFSSFFSIPWHTFT